MALTSSSGVQTLCMLAGLLVMVHGHGRLSWPPARTTAWRYTDMFPGAPVEFDDNQLYCGGRQVQWDQNNGQCGVCGDNIRDVVKKHELGPQSLVKKIIIVGTYKTGQVIDVTVEITVNHRGYFEFRLCVRDDHLTTKLTHECLNQNLLRDVSTNETRRAIGTHTGRYVTSLQLPPGVTCKECVLQWKYNTGNDWGICPDGVGRLGCSPTPEQFYGCADISITKDGDTSGGNNGNGGVGSNGNGNGGVGSNGNGNGGVGSNGNGNGGMWPIGNGHNGVEDGDTTTSPTTSTTTTGSNGNGDGASESAGCRPSVVYASTPGMKNWCLVNCLRGYCPSSHCSPECQTLPEPASSDCEPTLSNRNIPGMTNWCLNNCPRNCPSTLCNDACREL